MTNPLVSIIMPAYNAGRYIGEAIESVLNQTYPHWELIIVDDASTDDTQTVVARYTDPRIRYHRAERIGHPAGVRNAGLRMATGDLIAFLDADDAYFPYALTRLSKPLLENPRLTAVYGFAWEMDEHGRSLSQSIPLVRKKGRIANDEPAYELPSWYSHRWESIVTGQISCMLAGLMLRRSTWERIGFFNENLCGPEDYEFYLRLYLLDYEGVHCLSDYVYRYRIHAASLTKAPEHYERVLNSSIRILDWLFDEVPELPAHVHRYKSKSYTDCYRYLARERLIHHQPALARRIAMQALECPHVHLRDFLRQCMPVILRSYLPSSLNSRLVQVRRLLRDGLRAGRLHVQPS